MEGQLRDPDSESNKLGCKENADKDTCDGCLKIFQANSTGYLSCIPDTIPEKPSYKLT